MLESFPNLEMLSLMLDIMTTNPNLSAVQKLASLEIKHDKLKFLRLCPSPSFFPLTSKASSFGFGTTNEQPINLAEFFPNLEVLCLHNLNSEFALVQAAQSGLMKLRVLDIRGAAQTEYNPASVPGENATFETSSKKFYTGFSNLQSPPGAETVLDRLIKNQNLQLNKDFLEKIADVDCNIWPEGLTPLHMACLHTDLESIKFLVEEKKANVNAKVRLEMEKPWRITIPFSHASSNLPSFAPRGSTSLHIAVMRNAREVVEYLLQHGANTEERDSLGRTAFHYAVVTGSMEAVEALRRRCELQAKDKQGMHAGFFAVYSSKAKEMLEKVVEIGVKIEEKDNKGRSVHEAALSMVDEDINQYQEMFDCLPRLKEEEALEVVISHLKRYGEEFRWEDFSYNSVKLMRQKYELDLSNKIGGKTFLMHVLSYSELQLEKLFEAIFGPNGKFERLGIEEEDESGNRALHYGVAQGTLSHVKFLLKHGADISAKNKQGITPLLASETLSKKILF